jgi:hypothetical protein
MADRGDHRTASLCGNRLLDRRASLMLKPICVPCKRFFRMKRQGIAFIEGMPIRPDAGIGRREEEAWKPYKLWMGDLWVCPDCNATIISGFGRMPVAEQHMDGFKGEVTRLGAELQVNDC